MSNEAKFYNAVNIALQAESSNYRKLQKIFDEYGSWQKAWEANSYKIDADKEWSNLVNENIDLILQNDPRFPSLLKEIPWPPLGLYIKGRLPDNKNRIAIVGTRKATATGILFAKKLAKELTQADAIIVSGLALGIDEAAHKGVIEAGGKTIAVLAVGLEKIYPAQNTNLAKKILELGGAIISEYPPKSRSYPSRFIERNRIVSGLSNAVIVIEAPEKSGSLATARFAIEQNRDVLVAPGPVGHMNYIGSCQLIRSGASLINSVDDALNDLNMEITNKNNQTFLNLDELPSEQKQILNVLRNAGPSDVENLTTLTNLDITILNRNLALLLIKGFIKESHGKYIL